MWYGNFPFQISRYPNAFLKAQKCRQQRGGGKIPKEIMRLEKENALGWREISSHQFHPKQPFNVYVLFFEVPREVLKKLDFYRSRFFQQCDEHKKKYRLTKWSILCSPKEKGGLGILNLDVQNKCLLSKWLFKLINEDGVWQQILRRKYLRHKTITQVEYMPRDSHFWSGSMNIKPDFLRLGIFTS